jgi:hypothetical protein
MKSRVLFTLHRWLLDRYAAGQHTVLVVDEAQDLSLAALEEIRLLTNLETSSEKLLQIVLAGQPELEEKLNHRELRQLRQRIELRTKTMPLTAEETSAYVRERLRIAGLNGGGDGREIFTPEAIEAIHRYSHGIQRVTNLICEHAMVRAYAAERPLITDELIAAVTQDFSLDETPVLTDPEPPQRPRRRMQRRKGSARPVAHQIREFAEAADHAHTEVNSLGVTQMDLPLFVYGYGPDGAPFYEQAHTIATNARGGLISMRTAVEPGQKLLVTNKQTECSQECVVEFVGAQLARGIDVAFNFATPNDQFWGSRDVEMSPTGHNQEICA